MGPTKRSKPKNFFESKDGYFGEIRTLKTPERMRLSWQDSEWDKRSYVQVQVAAEKISAYCPAPKKSKLKK